MVTSSASKVVLMLDGVESLGGTVRWLRSGQKITVGRSGWADISVPGDEGLADVHFSVSLFGGRCRLQDLRSESGTFVNGERVLGATLRHGDRIMAGHSRFVVHIDDEAEDSAAPADSFSKSTPLATATVAGGADPLLESETLGSGLVRFRSYPEHAIGVPLIFERLLCQLPIFVLARFSAWSVPLPDELAGTTDTVPAVDHPRADKFASVLFHAAQVAEPLRLIEQLADAGDLLVVLTEADKFDLLERMRANPALFLSLDALRGTLAKAQADSVEQLLGPVAAVLLWREGAWDLFSRGQWFPHAHSLGFHDVSEMR